MAIDKTPSGFNDNTKPPTNPPPTGTQVRQIHKCRKSQRQTILEILKRDGCISSEQMRDMGYYSGAKRISELKEAGHIIQKTQDWKRYGIATYWYKGFEEPANE